MALTLHIDNCSVTGQAVWLPGQVISGHVSYEIRKEQEEIRDCSIEFSGKTQTEVTTSNGQSSRRDKEMIRLFFFKQQLFRGPFTMTPQTLTWPFQFTFPDAVSYERKNDSGPGYANSGSIELPPSFVHNTRSFSKNGHCFTRYKLKALLNDTKTFGGKKYERYLPVRRVLHSPLPQPTIQVCLFPGAVWQSRSLRENKHTFGQKMAHVFTNNPDLRNPSICFQLKVKVPAIINENQPSDLIFIAKHVRTGPTDPENPRLLLTSVNVKLQAYTELRVNRPLWSGSYTDDGKDWVCDASFRGTAPGSCSEPKVLALDESHTVMAQGWRFTDFSTNTMGLLVPDFSTWTIAHRHGLKIEVQVLHPDSGHIFKLETKMNCQILSDSINMLPGAPPPEIAPASMNAIQPPEEEQLPAYSSEDAGLFAAPPPPPPDAKQALS